MVSINHKDAIFERGRTNLYSGPLLFFHPTWQRLRNFGCAIRQQEEHILTNSF